MSKGTKYYPLCSECKEEYPQMNIIYKKNEIQFIFRCICSHEKQFTLDECYDYLNESNASLVITKCKLHDTPYSYYCIICKQSLCSICITTHQSHTELNYNCLIALNRINSDKINNTITKCENYIPKSLKLFLEKYKFRTDQKLMKGYSIFTKRNNKILFIMKCVVNSYSSLFPNYYLEESLRNSVISYSHFDVYYKEKDKDNKNDPHPMENYFDPKVKRKYQYVYIKEYFKDHSFVHPFYLNEKVTFNLSSITQISPIHLICVVNESIIFFNLYTYKEDYKIKGSKTWMRKIKNLEDGRILSYGINQCKFITYKILGEKFTYSIEDGFSYPKYHLNTIFEIKGNKFATTGLRNGITIIDAKKPYNVITNILPHYDHYISRLDYLEKKDMFILCNSKHEVLFINASTSQVVTRITEIYGNVNEIKSGLFLLGNYNYYDIEKGILIPINDNKIINNLELIDKLSNEEYLVGCVFGKLYLANENLTEFIELKSFHKISIDFIINLNKNTVASGSDDKIIFWKY